MKASDVSSDAPTTIQSGSTAQFRIYGSSTNSYALSATNANISPTTADFATLITLSEPVGDVIVTVDDIIVD